jgi:prepilin-type N-terminal cleavage/methylation domain-containing protein
MPKPKDTRLKYSGFTIIELLVVIVIIGILVTITVVNYNGVQARSRDTIVKNAAKQVAVELLRYSSDTGNTPLQTGGGYSSTGVGWVSAQLVDSNYPLAIETVLVNGGYLSSGFTAALPKNTKYNSNIYTLMLYECGSKYIVYYSLESPSSTDISDFSSVKTQCPNAASLQSSYNMQGGYIFN